MSETEQVLLKIEQNLIAELGPKATLLVNGEEKPVSKIVDEVRAHRARFVKPRQIEASFHAAVREREEDEPTVKKLIANLEQSFETRFGSQSEKLEVFGFRPRKSPGRRGSKKAAPEKGGEKPTA